MRPKVLISAPYAMPVLDRYRRELEEAGFEVVVAEVRERLSEAELLRLVGDVDGIICGDDQITPRVLDAAQRLKCISKWGTGIDSIAVEEARRRGVHVRNTPNAFTEPVADHALGWMLLFARRQDRMDADTKSGKWVKPPLFTLGEKTLGVVGVGNCGRAVIRRAAGFGMRILGHDIVEPPAAFVAEHNVEMTSFERLLRESDFVSLHTPLTPLTRKLMDAKAFAQMKPGAYLINTSRGPVVDEKALAEALESGRLAGAGLDVFEHEPLPADSPLRRFPNCYMSPHNANGSPAAHERVHRNTLRQLIEDLRVHA